MIECLADNTKHENREEMHKHLRRLRVKQELYYTTYHPRFDLFSGEPIPFDNTEQYLRTDFISKHNIKKFIKQKPDAARAWAVEWLAKRKEEKGLIYPPTHVELRSLMCPTVRYFNSVGGYHEICKGLGFKIRFDGKIVSTPLPAGTTLIQDTREQKPLDFPMPVQVKTLYVGDYHITGSRVYVERKSLNDFVGTITSRKRAPMSNTKVGIERFRAELDRARGAGYYIVMLVESDIDQALSFNYLPHMRYTKATPEHIFKNLRDLLIEYTDCFQALFVKNRFEAAQTVVKIFEAGESIKTVDCQFLYEEGLLCGSNQKTL